MIFERIDEPPTALVGVGDLTLRYRIAMLDEQRKVTKKGGTMRLGAQECQLAVGSKAAQLYGSFLIHERHQPLERRPVSAAPVPEEGRYLTLGLFHGRGHPLGCPN